MKIKEALGLDSRAYTILVVDDNEDNLELISGRLKELGFRTLAATGGKRGLEMAQGQRPDLILMDVVMPGMDGLQVCRRLKADEETRGIPVIFLSVLATTEHKLQWFQAGAVDYITKPLEDDKILARIVTHLRLRELNERLEAQVRERTNELLLANQQLEQQIAEREQLETQRDLTLAALRESEGLLRDIFDGIQDGISLLDLDFNIVRTNTWAERMYAVQSPLVGKKCHQVYYGQGSPCAWCPARQTIETGEAHSEIISYALTEELAGWTELSAYPIKDETGRVRGIIEHAKDITEQVRAEEALRRSKEMLQLVIDNIPQFIFWKNRDSVYLGCNKNFAQESGVGEPRNIVGKTDYDLMWVEEAELARQRDRQVIDSDTPEYHVIRPYHIGERRAWLDTSKIPLHDTHGVVVGVLGANEDITERVQAEEELERHRERLEELVQERTRKLEDAQAELVCRERLSALGELTAIVAHEIRNPLGTVRTAVFAIDDAIERGELNRVGRTLELAERNIVRCDNIIRKLLDYTHDRTLDPRPMHIDTWLGVVLDEQTIPPGIVCVRELEADVKALIDHEHFRRAISNIVDNAIDALQNRAAVGNRLTVRTRVVENQAGSRLEIQIKDTGPGIPADVLPRVFDLLFSAKSLGVGLGLPIVQNIMEQHGGGIELQSQVGEGTTVTLWLPV
jgi:PAS domain S-box-containing protein